MSDPTPSPKTPGNSTHDLLNDLGEEMARLNRQTERVVFWLELIGRTVLAAFLVWLFIELKILGAFAILYLLVALWYASKKIR